MLADALFDDYFIASELCKRGIDIVARAQYDRVGSRTAQSSPGDDIIVWERPNKPRGMTGEQYRSYPKNLIMLAGDATTAAKLAVAEIAKVWLCPLIEAESPSDVSVRIAAAKAEFVHGKHRYITVTPYPRAA